MGLQLGLEMRKHPGTPHTHFSSFLSSFTVSLLLKSNLKGGAEERAIHLEQTFETTEKKQMGKILS